MSAATTASAGEQLDDGDLPIIPTPLPTASAVTLYNVYPQISPTTDSTLKQRNSELRLENATLKSAIASKSHGKGRKPKTTDLHNDLVLNYDQIISSGKEFCIMVEPWIDTSLFGKPLPSDTSMAISIDRFHSYQSYRDGDNLDLSAHLQRAPGLKEVAEKVPGFGEQFYKQLGNERSSSLKTIRDHATNIFPELTNVVPLTIWDAGKQLTVQTLQS
ncbi:hypothetical protein VKT23_020495 [Stygiomarasmius scandens]|uniref:Uncharacterized protein n=1 Tax=Marasmiellus scandens TaxID=2682957 RepID=A0ABR1IMT7_9AGAR